jgi:uncharacterized membrane protein YebE (DUF533 family)
MSTDRILSQLLGSPAASGFAGGLAGGLASGLLTSRAGRKLGKRALKVGGIAAVGGLAYAAWRRYRYPATGAPGGEAIPGPGSFALERFVPPSRRSPEAERLGLTLLRAMVAAAQADGRIDEREREALHERVDALELSGPEKAELIAQLGRPVDMNELALAARSPEIAAEIYTASLLAIEVDTPAERAYLAMLAARLELPHAQLSSIHRELGVPEPGATSPPAELRFAS